MKKIALLLVSASLLFACQSKKEKKTAPVANTYELNANASIVNWTGFKFTDKKGVKGQLKTLNITHKQAGTTIKEALENAAFSIPISSIFSNNNTRDVKLRMLFFGMMKNTELLSGKVTAVNDKQIVVALKMNDEIHDLTFDYTIQNSNAYLTSTLDLATWNAMDALASIHKACELLHTGADGVSKTWQVVDLDITLGFSKN